MHLIASDVALLLILFGFYEGWGRHRYLVYEQAEPVRQHVPAWRKLRVHWRLRRGRAESGRSEVLLVDGIGPEWAIAI